MKKINLSWQVKTIGSICDEDEDDDDEAKCKINNNKHYKNTCTKYYYKLLGAHTFIIFYIFSATWKLSSKRHDYISIIANLLLNYTTRNIYLIHFILVFWRCKEDG